MKIVNAVRAPLLPLPPARKILTLSLLAAFCTLHGPAVQADIAPITTAALDTGVLPPDLPEDDSSEHVITEAVTDTLPVTGNAEPGTPHPATAGPNDSATTLANATLQPGISTLLSRLQPAIIYVPPAVTDPVDLAILSARKAMQSGNLGAFDAAVAVVPRGHVLSGYLDYWRLRIRLAQAATASDADYLATSADARAYLARFPRTLTADLLRRDWMLAAGTRQDWASIDALYPHWTLKDESAPECLKALSALARTTVNQRPGVALLKSATGEILKPQALNASCTALLQTLAEHNLLTPAQRQQRLHLALEINSPADIRTAAQLLPTPPDTKALDLALNKPGILLGTTPAPSTPRSTGKASSRPAAQGKQAQAGSTNKRTTRQGAKQNAKQGTTPGTKPGTRTGTRQHAPQSARAVAGQKNTGSTRTARAAAQPTVTPLLARIALVRLAKQDPVRAAQLLKDGKTATGKPLRLGPAERAFVWSQIAMSGMFRRDRDAPRWAEEARHAKISDYTRVWLARAALGEQQWTQLDRIIRTMGPALRNSPTWTYWHGRAQQALGHPKAAQQAFQSLASRHDYYGKLAREELGLPHHTMDTAFAVHPSTALHPGFGVSSAPSASPAYVSAYAAAASGVANANRSGVPHGHTAATGTDKAPGSATRNARPGAAGAAAAVGTASAVGAAAGRPGAAGDRPGSASSGPVHSPAISRSLLRAVENDTGIRQAMAFYELGLRGEGNREWNFQMRGRNPEQLRAAATWAARHGLLDRAINTEERILTGPASPHLRFPTPFAEQLLTITQQQAIDPAWVYGLIRQESRFVMAARSSVGASGLMQIMPATAKWIAKQMGNTTYQPDQLNNLDTNLTFGSYYLKRALDDLNGSAVLATAGYNAGPRRAHTWRDSLTQPMEGAIFTELIPFTETRGYVKAVLSNTVDYATLFTGQPQSIKDWLSTIAPKPVMVTQLP